MRRRWIGRPLYSAGPRVGWVFASLSVCTRRPGPWPSARLPAFLLRCAGWRSAATGGVRERCGFRCVSIRRCALPEVRTKNVSWRECTTCLCFKIDSRYSLELMLTGPWGWSAPRYRLSEGFWSFLQQLPACLTIAVKRSMQGRVKLTGGRHGQRDSVEGRWFDGQGDTSSASERSCGCGCPGSRIICKITCA